MAIFKTKNLIYQSKANLDENFFFKHLYDPTIRKMHVKGFHENREFHAPFWSMIYVALKFTLPVCDTESEFQYKVNHGPEYRVSKKR